MAQRLKRRLKRSTANSDPVLVMSQLCNMYNYQVRDVADVCCKLLTCDIIGRELVRLNVPWDAMTFSGSKNSLSAKEFIQLVTTTNAVRAAKPSIAKAYNADVGQSLHRHHVYMIDDAWYMALDMCVHRWLQQKVDPTLVAQLVSMAATFNFQDVMNKLAKCSPATLPLQAGTTIPENERNLHKWLRQLQTAGKRIFSIRLSTSIQPGKPRHPPVDVASPYVRRSYSSYRLVYIHNQAGFRVQEARMVR